MQLCIPDPDSPQQRTLYVIRGAAAAMRGMRLRDGLTHFPFPFSIWQLKDRFRAPALNDQWRMENSFENENDQ